MLDFTPQMDHRSTVAAPSNIPDTPGRKDPEFQKNSEYFSDDYVDNYINNFCKIQESYIEGWIKNYEGDKYRGDGILILIQR